MRIVQIGPYPIDPSVIRGGVESSVFGLVQEQAKTNDVFVMDIPRISGTDRIERFGNLTVYRFSNHGKHQQDAVDRVKDICPIITGLKPTICHIHSTSVFSWRLYRALSRMGVPAIVTVHGLSIIEKKKELKRQFSIKKLYQLFVQANAERSLLQSAKDIIVDTKYVSEAIDAYRLRRTPQRHVIPQGIDSRFFGIFPALSSSEVLSVGAISKRKGHLLLLKSFEKVCDVNKNAHLTICGSLADSVYYNELLSFLSSSRIKNRVTIMTNATQRELDNCYRSAAVFALHSQEESQGIALVEAMAAGLPIVSTRVGGIPWVVDDKTTGFLSEYGDIQSFADKISTLLGSHDLVRSMSERSRESALRYSWAGISDEILALYNQFITLSAH